MTTHSQAELSFDVVVVGAGTAGLAAAKSAHAEGARVAVVDHGPLGTFCARLGCMPSKSLLQSSWALARARRLGKLGVRVDTPPTFDWPAVRAREQELVARFVEGVVAATTRSESFALLRGNAEFERDGALRVDGKRVTAKRWVLATGSTPVRPPIAGLDDVAAFTITSDDVFSLPAIPSSVAVIGSGPVGVELGQFFARAGARVHLVAQDDHIAGLAPGVLRDALVAPLARELTLHQSSRIERVHLTKSRGRENVVVALTSGETFTVGQVLLAAGRRPNLDGLGLDRIGVRVDHGVPTHDEYLRTSNRAVFVAGDAAGAPSLLHTATIQGRTAGLNAACEHEEPLVRPKLEPMLRVVFSDPIVATVGLDPDAAKVAGHSVCVASRPWSEQAKARIMDETEGLAQLVVDRASRKLLGGQIVGPEADMLIHLVSYAILLGATVDDVLGLHHYHPTLAEMIPSLAQMIVSELDGAPCTRGEIAAAHTMQ